MKIIHVADIHLDSPLSHLPPDKVKERKAEIINAFERLVQYATQNGVSAIIIAGDFFDSQKSLKTTRERVVNVIARHPEIEFYYATGNHEGNSFLLSVSELPKNFNVFKEEFTTFNHNGVKITGVSLHGNGTIVYDALSLNPSDVNIVVLHGQTVNHVSKTEKAETISLSKLKGKNIDYLALGHIHYNVVEPLDNRGVYAYSGCLEGRGYDECGVKGFYLLEVENGKVTPTFVPFAKRTTHSVEVNLASYSVWNDAEEEILTKLSSVPFSDMVRVNLVGKYEPTLRKNVDMLGAKLDSYYDYKIKDDSVMKLNKADIESDLSLRGEFMRQLQSSKLTEEEIEGALIYGLKAIEGEEL